MEESKSEEVENNSQKKFLAPSHMSFVKPLNNYNENDIKRKLSVSGPGAEPVSPHYKMAIMKDNSSDGPSGGRKLSNHDNVQMISID